MREARFLSGYGCLQSHSRSRSIRSGAEVEVSGGAPVSFDRDEAVVPELMEHAADLVAIEPGDPADVRVDKGFGTGLGTPADHTDHSGLEAVPSPARIAVGHRQVRPDDDLRFLAKVVRGCQPGMGLGR